MEYCSRNDFHNYSSRNTRSGGQLSLLASTIQGTLNRHPPISTTQPEQPQTEQGRLFLSLYTCYTSNLLLKIYLFSHVNKEFMSPTKEQRREYLRQWIMTHKTHFLEMNRRTKRRRHREVIMRLGGKCSVCGIDDFRCLQIDHIHGGGSKEIRGFRDTYGYHVALLRLPENELRAKYQLLCANCNWIKRYEQNET